MYQPWIMKFRRNISWVMLFLSLCSLPWIIVPLIFYFKACNFLGYNPTYNHPDPKELSFYEGYNTIITLSGNLWLMSFFTWVFVVIVTIIVTRKSINWKPIVLSLIPHVLSILVLLSDITKWFFD